MKDLKYDSKEPVETGSSLPPVLVALVVAACVCRTLRRLMLLLALALVAQLTAQSLVARTRTLLCFLPDVSAFVLAGRSR